MSDTKTDYIKIARELFEETGILLKTEKREEYTTLYIRIPSAPGPTMLCYIRIDESGFFSFTCYPVYGLENDKLIKGALLANLLNDEYRFFRNFIDSEGDYNIRYEVFLIGDEDQVREQISGLLLLFTNLLEELIPQIMSLIAVDPLKNNDEEESYD